MIKTQNARETTGLVFPTKLLPEQPLAQVSRGDMVQIRGRKDLGDGTVLEIDANGRLARVVFADHDGWWSRRDLVKV